jgi:RNA polymerase sigma-B factor
MAVDPARREELRRLLGKFLDTRGVSERDRLVEAHLPLARTLARRFTDRGQPLDDLEQVAALALVKAVERFDPAHGAEFSTYAAHTILGELKRFFRDTTWAVRAPRRLQELYLELTALVSELSQQKGRSPTIGELAAAAAVSEEDVLEAMEAGQAYRFASLDTPNNDDDDGPSAEPGELDKGLADAPDRVELDALLATLPERERTIMYLRFWEDKTQAEIATELGISQMHVSRLLARSLARLRDTAYGRT